MPRFISARALYVIMTSPRERVETFATKVIQDNKNQGSNSKTPLNVDEIK